MSQTETDIARSAHELKKKKNATHFYTFMEVQLVSSFRDDVIHSLVCKKKKKIPRAGCDVLQIYSFVPNQLLQNSSCCHKWQRKEQIPLWGVQIREYFYEYKKKSQK